MPFWLKPNGTKFLSLASLLTRRPCHPHCPRTTLARVFTRHPGHGLARIGLTIHCWLASSRRAQASYRRIHRDQIVITCLHTRATYSENVGFLGHLGSQNGGESVATSESPWKRSRQPRYVQFRTLLIAAGTGHRSLGRVPDAATQAPVRRRPDGLTDTLNILCLNGTRV